MAHLVRIRGCLAQLGHLLRVLNMTLSDMLTGAAQLLRVDLAVVVAVICAASILDGVSEVGEGLIRSHLFQSVRMLTEAR